MGVRVEETELAELQEVCLREILGQQRPVEALTLELLQVRDLCTGDEGERQNFGGGELIYNFGARHPLDLLEILSPPSRVFSLCQVVDLSIKNDLGILEHVDPHLRSAFHSDLVLVQHDSNLVKLCQIKIVHLLQLVSLDLDGKLFAILRPGSMHLSKGRSRHGLVIELLEELAGRLAELRLDDLERTSSAERRNLVLQRFQLFYVLLAHKVLTAGEDLSQLHIGRAKSHQFCHGSLAGFGVDGRLLCFVARELRAQGNEAHPRRPRHEGHEASIRPLREACPSLLHLVTASDLLLVATQHHERAEQH
mmetsp:Transcript_36593/g.76500  ORF Transcript_36593/g.76500 Transcript_36593/m.76500 type:complete len:308 (+) Transcript_36593:605-1528(+)